MLSYTGRRNSFQDLTNASDSTTLALADRLTNQSEKRILTMKDWPFLEALDTSLTTTASTQFYNIPQNVSKPKSIYITVSSITYTPREITSREEWDRVNYLSYTSDFPAYYYVFNKQIGIWPKPASSSNTIGIIYRQTPKDLTIADYTTGTIVSIANGGTAVVGSGTAWTTKMANNRFIRITDSDTANTGDGFWYPISAVGSATTITLGRPYVGTAISAGSAAYTIGQMSLLPEGYTDLPVFDAVRQYFTTIQPDVNKAKLYDGLFKELMEQMVKDQSDKTSSPVLDYGIGYNELINPNLTIQL